MAQRTRELEAAIDKVVSSYEGPDEINNLDTAALPNKRDVVEGYKHLRPAIYMGFFSLRSLDRDNLRYALSEHLYPAYELFVEQIGRALLYEERFHGGTRAVGYAEEVTLSLLHKLPEIRQTLNADIVAAFEGDPAARSIEEIVFSYPAVEAITAYRVAHELYLASVPIIPRIISEYAHSQTGIDIHPGAQIGPRLLIDHGTGVVIGETAVIGSNVKLFQGVTLGALSVRRAECGSPRSHKRHPTIEDNVTIYAGATILGGETVI
ncbi:MAG TPA: serine acetyltransferase, partial [Polyangiaceae bacterium]|nr:serine acetyltransferase [Polyangiaceae bacterium]